MRDLASLTAGKDTVLAFRTAMGDVYGNIAPFRDGLLEEPKPCLLAGLEYDTPWTRDASVQAWNGMSLFFPDVIENTLMSVLTKDGGKIRAGGQYWDAIIWVTGAWQHYLITGDMGFLRLAREAAVNSLGFFEETEFDPEMGLFRGAACYGDGIAAYDDGMAASNGGSSAILNWPRVNPGKTAGKGGGIPLYALSTNCLYYNAYRLADFMSAELGLPEEWGDKAARLRDAINDNFWCQSRGSYDYYIGPHGRCEAQEGLGISFALLFGVAGAFRAREVVRSCRVDPAGIACVWPSFPRYYYSAEGEPAGNAFGRHSGTVWPFIQGFWADAAWRSGDGGRMLYEFERLRRHARENGHFSELYHPLTGKPYGGMQEENGRIREWESFVRQTWSATAYLRVLLYDVFGLSFERDGIAFGPCLPPDEEEMTISGLRCRGAVLRITLRKADGRGRRLAVGGEAMERMFLPLKELKADNIDIEVYC